MTLPVRQFFRVVCGECGHWLDVPSRSVDTAPVYCSMLISNAQELFQLDGWRPMPGANAALCPECAGRVVEVEDEE